MIVCLAGLVSCAEGGVEKGVVSVGRWLSLHSLGRRWITGDSGWSFENRIAVDSDSFRRRWVMGGTWLVTWRALTGVVRNAPAMRRSALFWALSRIAIKVFCRLSSQNHMGAA
jgi:hypothetical protein